MAPAAMGKSDVMDFTKIVFNRFDEENLLAETQLNLYNQEVTKANNAKEITANLPDVCLRKVSGKFTEAGFEDGSFGFEEGTKMCFEVYFSANEYQGKYYPKCNSRFYYAINN